MRGHRRGSLGGSVRPESSLNQTRGTHCESETIKLCVHTRLGDRSLSTPEACFSGVLPGQNDRYKHHVLARTVICVITPITF
jgi:hypothetical protein